MKIIFKLILFIGLQVCFSQKMEIKFLDSISLKAEKFIGIDEFDNYYYTINNTLYKKTNAKTYSYTNNLFGKITSIDITNPLKILLFYRGFNTIVLLDNRLNELNDVINLTTEKFLKNVSFAGICSNNNLWLFSNDDNTLTLWNYENGNTIFESQPLSFYADKFHATNLKSNYKYCWIYSKTEILKFNEFGTYLETISLKQQQKVHPSNEGYFTIKNDKLYYTNKTAQFKIEESNFNHKKENVIVKNGMLYFFDTNTVYRYKIIKI